MLPRLALVLSLALLAAPAWAQSFPSRPVRMVVPFAPGGPVDIVARLVAARLTVQLGQQVIVDNRPGAGGSVGGELVARAVPDGHTSLLASNGTLAISPHLMKLSYDAARDLAPVGLVGTSPQALVVPPSSPATSVKDLVALARAKPRSVNYASSGQGSTSHLATELFRSAAGIDMVHVPYKGAGPAVNDLIAGQTHMMITGVSLVLPHVKSGRLRVLGVTSRKRIAALPDTPSISETLPGYEVTTWYGLLVTAGTSAGIIARLNQEIVKAVAHAEVGPRLSAAGVGPETGTPQQFAAMIRSESEKWGKLIKAAGVTAQQ
jgi:tripartite-type tricarboxylate transporter receptor subunit TctC